MMSYLYFPPEEKNWCVPSALQSLLDWKGFKISQREIAEHFPEERYGMKLDNKSLNAFFEDFGLISEFHNPHESMEFYEDFGNFLESSFGLGDVIMAYDLAEIGEGSGRKPEGHVSLVSYVGKNEIYLLDRKEIFHPGDFIKGMNPWIDKNYGVYTVTKKS